MNNIMKVASLYQKRQRRVVQWIRSGIWDTPEDRLIQEEVRLEIEQIDVEIEQLVKGENNE